MTTKNPSKSSGCARRFNKNLMRDHLYLFPDLCQVAYEAVATCHWLTTQVGPIGVELVRQSWFPG